MGDRRLVRFGLLGYVMLRLPCTSICTYMEWMDGMNTYGHDICYFTDDYIYEYYIEKKREKKYVRCVALYFICEYRNAIQGSRRVWANQTTGKIIYIYIGW